jgi:hypothetical protein
MKPAPARGEIDGEFDIFAGILLDNPAEKLGERMENLFA